MIKGLARWLWLKATGEDLITMIGQRRDLCRLNGTHVEFINELRRFAKDTCNHQLYDLLERHDKDRGKALDYSNNE